MNSRQDHILRVLASIAVGAVAFCLTVPAAMLLGGILCRPWLKNDVLFPPQLAILILVSIAAGIALGIAAGRKYYDHPGKKQGQ
jgi:uncharacterized membrane protein AbrB (regulator of aidB expression)